MGKVGTSALGTVPGAIGAHVDVAGRDIFLTSCRFVRAVKTGLAISTFLVIQVGIIPRETPGAASKCAICAEPAVSLAWVAGFGDGVIPVIVSADDTLLVRWTSAVFAICQTISTNSISIFGALGDEIVPKAAITVIALLT